MGITEVEKSLSDSIESSSSTHVLYEDSNRCRNTDLLPCEERPLASHIVFNSRFDGDDLSATLEVLCALNFFGFDPTKMSLKLSSLFIKSCFDPFSTRPRDWHDSFNNESVGLFDRKFITF